MTGPATLLGALGGVPERGERERGPVNGFLGCEDAVEALLNSAAAAVSSQVTISHFYVRMLLCCHEHCQKRVDLHHLSTASPSSSSPVPGSVSEFEQQPGRLQQRQRR